MSVQLGAVTDTHAARVGTLLLVRHGQSLANAQDRFAGWLDVPLTGRGEAEALRAAELIDEAAALPEVVHTSVLTRSIRTADIMLEALGRSEVPTFRTWRLNERHYGALQGRHKAEVRAEVSEDTYQRWRRAFRGRYRLGERPHRHPVALRLRHQSAAARGGGVPGCRSRSRRRGRGRRPGRWAARRPIPPSLPGHDREAIARALRIPALSPGWQQSFRAMLTTEASATGNVGLTDAAAAVPVAWPGFRPLRVVGVDRESDAVVSLRLAASDGQRLPAGVPGQFVAVRLAVDGAASPITRSYSLSGPATGGRYRISVKREADGAFGTYLSSHSLAGTELEVTAPRGGFTLQAGNSPVLLLSAGIGATPVLAMLHALVAAKSTCDVWWLHGARNSAEHPFAREVTDLLAGLPNSRREICYSAPLPGDEPGRDYTHRGRLDADLLHRLPVPPEAHAYVCGPLRFMADIRSALTDLLIDPGRITTETFGARSAITPGIAAAAPTAPHQPAGRPGTGPAVTFARTGLTVRWPSRVGSVLELAEACDVPTRWSCRTAICHTCETGLLAGTVTYDPQPIDQPADGNTLICCAVPATDLVLDL